MKYRNKVIVPIGSVNKAGIHALKYAKTICDDVVAFTVVLNEEASRDILAKFQELNIHVPLVIRLSPCRKIVEPLLRYIESTEYDHEAGDIITVLLSSFVLKKWWHHLLHGNTRSYIERKLLTHEHIVVSTIPLQLKDDPDLFNIHKKLNPSCR